MINPFEDDDYYTGPQLEDSMIIRAEADLGVRLPRSYVALISLRNGGTPKRRCFPTTFPTSWAEDHFEISGIRGIGGDWGIDSSAGIGGSQMIREWEYPNIGVVICDTPSAGQDTVMLDYTDCGPVGEPAVAYVDEDRIPRRVADNFEAFIGQLVSCDEFEE